MSEQPHEILEECLTRHRKEKKDLLVETQKLKHSVPKGDKKKKKEVTDRVEALESELEARHKAELLRITPASEPFRVDPASEPQLEPASEPATDCATRELAERLDGVALTTETTPLNNGIGDFKFNEAADKKPSKSKRRKEKKVLKNQEQESKIKEQELANKNGPRSVEAEKIKKLLRARHLVIYEIPSDGNCLYSAINDQLKKQDAESSVETLRRQTADYMRLHPDEFLPFLVKEGTDELYSPGEFQEYCTRIESTPEWGGHTEIRAISDVLRVPIEVVQAEGPSILIGEQFQRMPLILSYHRHAYGLGAHYNSVVPIGSADDSKNQQQA